MSTMILLIPTLKCINLADNKKSNTFYIYLLIFPNIFIFQNVKSAKKSGKKIFRDFPATYEKISFYTTTTLVIKLL